VPSGGIVYFFTEEAENLPRLVVTNQTYEMSSSLMKEGIIIREINKQDYERERFLIEGQHIRLFFGYFLNWVIAKNLSIEIFSNFLFDYSFREFPLIFKFEENRPEYDRLRYTKESEWDESKSKLYLIRYQSIFYRSDLLKLEKKISELEEEFK
jgi:hypothetical protein